MRRVGQQGGFSLIELLIAVALVVIMYTLYLSGGSRNYQTTQKKACQKNLQNAYMALKTYSVENEDRFPVVEEATHSEVPLSLLVPRCTTVTDFFVCPGTKDKAPPAAKPFDKARISYAYYMGRSAAQGPSMPLMTDEQIDAEAKQVGAALFSPDGKGAGSNHGKFGGVILFCDGSAQITDTNAPVALPLGKGVTLLNPKP